MSKFAALSNCKIARAAINNETNSANLVSTLFKNQVPTTSRNQ
jgi:hypothetical protein